MQSYDKLTKLFNGITRHRYPYNETDISKNGIYIMFEKGEKHSRLDRIVRIGSHTGQNRLFERIDEHYIGNDHRNSGILLELINVLASSISIRALAKQSFIPIISSSIGISLREGL